MNCLEQVVQELLFILSCNRRKGEHIKLKSGAFKTNKRNIVFTQNAQLACGTHSHIISLAQKLRMLQKRVGDLYR